MKRHLLTLTVAVSGLHWLLGSDLLAQSAKEHGRSVIVAPTASTNDPSVSVMRDIIERFTSDLAALGRYHSISVSQKRTERLRGFYEDQLRRLEFVNFEALDQDGRVDYLLLKNKLRYELQELDHDRKRVAEVAGLIPFSQSIIQLEEARRRMETTDPERNAKLLTGIAEQIVKAHKEVEKQLKTGKEKSDKDAARPAPGKVAANRAARVLDELRQTLRRWHEFYAGYDPEFTWWADPSYQKADKELQDYAAFLRKNVVGLSGRATDSSEEVDAPRARSERAQSGPRRSASSPARVADSSESEDDPVIGDPIGRQALLDALRYEMIPYTPEELIDIANKELAWCEVEQHRAARDLGFGDDWRKTLDHVSNMHVKPGEQPRLIKDLAEEAIKFVEDRNLVTVPDLCKEIWRMEMMPP